MTNARHVLGWAHRCAPQPSAFETIKVGALYVVLAPPHSAANPRALLQYQVAWFQNGLDLLPTAPSIRMLKKNAIALAETYQAEISATLDRLTGMGQLTLSAAWAPPDQQEHIAKHGRDWLHARQRHHATSQKRKAGAMDFLQGCDFAEYETRLRHTRHCIDRDMLIPRAERNATLNRIHQRAAACETDDFSLAVTGLWPPFSFAQPFSGSNGTVT